MPKKKSPAPPFIPALDRSSEMPFDEMHLNIEKAIEKLKVPRVRHACRSAINHLRKAWLLHPVDSEMSAFRAITAEEEAATAVIRALRERRYPNSEKLSDRSHPQKSAIWPFIVAISNVMTEKNITMPSMALRLEGEPRVELSFDLGSPAKLEQPLWGQLDEPFNFSMRSDRTGPFKLHDFSEELAAIASDKGAKSIEAYVLSEGNLRNQLIYASDQGIASIAFEDGFLLERRRRVTAMSILAIAIMQTPTHQLFLVQCLDALLRAVQRFDGNPLDMPELDPALEHLELAEQPDGTMKLSLIRPVKTLSFRYSSPPRTK